MLLDVVESKAQGWRAIAKFADGSEALLYVGMSGTQVRTGYGPSLQSIYEEGDCEKVTEIRLEQWYGAPDAGKWMEKAKLRIPEPKLAKVAA
ncbi:MAG: hypothetical protein U0798_15740 [Gemmataceae bacterium]